MLGHADNLIHRRLRLPETDRVHLVVGALGEGVDDLPLRHVVLVEDGVDGGRRRRGRSGGFGGRAAAAASAARVVGVALRDHLFLVDPYQVLVDVVLAPSKDDVVGLGVADLALADAEEAPQLGRAGAAVEVVALADSEGVDDIAAEHADHRRWS